MATGGEEPLIHAQPPAAHQVTQHDSAPQRLSIRHGSYSSSSCHRLILQASHKTLTTPPPPCPLHLLIPHTPQGTRCVSPCTEQCRGAGLLCPGDRSYFAAGSTQHAPPTHAAPVRAPARGTGRHPLCQQLRHPRPWLLSARTTRRPKGSTCVATQSPHPCCEPLRRPASRMHAGMHAPSGSAQRGGEGRRVVLVRVQPSSGQTQRGRPPSPCRWHTRTAGRWGRCW